MGFLDLLLSRLCVVLSLFGAGGGTLRGRLRAVRRRLGAVRRLLRLLRDRVGLIGPLGCLLCSGYGPIGCFSGFLGLHPRRIGGGLCGFKVVFSSATGQQCRSDRHRNETPNQEPLHMFSPVEFAGTATQTAPQTNSGAVEKFARQIDVTAMTQERSHEFADAIGDESIETHARAL
ncbi:MAG TPA: hypothetical protein VEU95_11575 [Micropepsaceae bacterium]|nr:hypothetical protein [Micropepsaceae bacterium]